MNSEDPEEIKKRVAERLLGLDNLVDSITNVICRRDLFNPGGIEQVFSDEQREIIRRKVSGCIREGITDGVLIINKVLGSLDLEIISKLIADTTPRKLVEALSSSPLSRVRPIDTQDMDTLHHQLSVSHRNYSMAEIVNSEINDVAKYKIQDFQGENP